MYAQKTTNDHSKIPHTAEPRLHVRTKGDHSPGRVKFPDITVKLKPTFLQPSGTTHSAGADGLRDWRELFESSPAAAGLVDRRPTGVSVCCGLPPGGVRGPLCFSDGLLDPLFTGLRDRLLPAFIGPGDGLPPGGVCGPRLDSRLSRGLLDLGFGEPREPLRRRAGLRDRLRLGGRFLAELLDRDRDAELLITTCARLTAICPGLPG